MDKQEEHPRYQALRAAAALLILMIMTLLVLVSYIPSAVIQSCHQAVENGVTTTNCGPIGTDDIVLVGLVLLVAAAFVAPELSEFSVAGLVSVKRRVEEAVEKADQATAAAKELTVKAAETSESVRKVLEYTFQTAMLRAEVTAGKINDFIDADTRDKAVDIGAKYDLSPNSVTDVRDRLIEWRQKHAADIEQLSAFQKSTLEQLSDDDLAEGFNVAQRVQISIPAAVGPLGWGVFAGLR